MPTKDSRVVRLRNEALDQVDALAGDSILVLARLGPLDRSGVVTLGCQLLTLVARDVAQRESSEPDPRWVTDFVPAEVLSLLYDRWLGQRGETTTHLRRQGALLREAMALVRELKTQLDDSRDGERRWRETSDRQSALLDRYKDHADAMLAEIERLNRAAG